MNLRRTLYLRTIILFLVVGGILALSLSGFLTPFFRVALSPVLEAQTWLTIRFKALSDFFTAPRDLTALRQRNQELEAEVALLQAQVIELQQENTEIQLLSALLDFARSDPSSNYMAANVIGRDPNPFLHYVIINRGSDHGLRRGMPVVTAKGLVGRIAAVTAGAARVQLITDPATSINIRLQNTDTDALLLGSVTGDLSLDMISQDTEVQLGDIVLTSGLGGNYPANILVGQVATVRSRSFDLFQTASVQPVVDFSKLDIVLVIQNFRPVDITPLIPAP